MEEFLSMLVLFLPLFVILFMANVAERQRILGEPHQALAWLTYLLTAGIYLMPLMLGLVLWAQPDLLGLVMQIPDLEADLQLSVGIILLSLLGMALLLPPLRSVAARFTALDPANLLHGVSLSLTMVVPLYMLLTLGIGLGNLAAQMEEAAAAGLTVNNMLIVWVQQVLMLLLAMVGVGWLARRSSGEATARLGLVLPTGRQTLIGIGSGLALVAAASLFSIITSQLGFLPDVDAEKLTEQLLGPLFESPIGILTLGLAAALGEEPLFRGAMQPRFGLFLTTALFALLHSNYGLSVSTLLVFLLGATLGILRNRYNTSTAMITHAVFNITQGVLAYLATNVFNLN